MLTEAANVIRTWAAGSRSRSAMRTIAVLAGARSASNNFQPGGDGRLPIQFGSRLWGNTRFSPESRYGAEPESRGMGTSHESQKVDLIGNVTSGSLASAN